jgi:hypothetical protein
MLLTSRVTKRLDVPGQAGQWVEIRKLGWRKLEEASSESSKAAASYVRALGKEGLEAVRAVTAEQIKAYQATAKAQYDHGTLLRGAVLSWSLSEHKPPKPDELDDLEEDFKEWLVDEILALARPPRDEATVKND